MRLIYARCGFRRGMLSAMMPSHGHDMNVYLTCAYIIYTHIKTEVERESERASERAMEGGREGGRE